MNGIVYCYQFLFLVDFSQNSYYFTIPGNSTKKNTFIMVLVVKSVPACVQVSLLAVCMYLIVSIVVIIIMYINV